MDDFNYPNINWCDKQYITPTSGDFIHFCEDIFLNQNLEDGTRGGNTLDLIFQMRKLKKIWEKVKMLDLVIIQLSDLIYSLNQKYILTMVCFQISGKQIGRDFLGK